VDDVREKSEAGTIISMAEADAKAVRDRASAEREKLIAEAEGRAAIISSENTQSPELIAMKLQEARLRTLPGVVERMMKPAEKIETIRINQMTGFGGSGRGDGEGADKSTVNQVVDSVLSMALQLPAVQKLGEEVGMNIGGGLRGITAPLDGEPPKAGRADNRNTSDTSSDTKS
jgi:uncharacterized membrane protein YqiK